MGCGKSKDAEAPAPAGSGAGAAAGASAAAPSQSNDTPDWHAKAQEAKQVADKTKEITEEAFENGIQKLLALAIDGYPDAFQSAKAKRNQLLRDTNGDQDAAIDLAMERSANAEMRDTMKATMQEEAKMTLLSMIPGVGLPITLVYPTWKRLQKMCLVASLNGWDLDLESTRAEILLIFTTGEKTIQGEASVAKAAGILWKRFAGPLKILPVSSLVGAVNDAEGKADAAMEADLKGQRRPVSEADYSQVLDPKPDMESYKRLLKKGGNAFQDIAFSAGQKALEKGQAAASAAAAAVAPHAGAIAKAGGAQAQAAGAALAKFAGGANESKGGK